ncbi:hypothetical protein [Phenylobacterium sp.]|uniref:hypothetical protein n=1 Tax=Phenylobacterium sp. TaxID=1871053 RepID=UPI00289CAD8E|nr:hypothetical protein [Phenylobacterium sp.]
MPQPRDPTPNRPSPPRRRPPGEAPPDAARDLEESRSFATDTPPGGHMGAAGDPAEGKRD